MGKISFLVVLITCLDKKEANLIAKNLLSQKKAACVNIIPGINSLFWWQDKIDKANEVLLVVKSASELLGDIIKLVRKLHSYDVPEIIALPIIGGYKDYLKWISDSVKHKGKSLRS